jgi:Asp-tRNA(Asn)/Glu-tRNA(Gln) amidotransferase A subunit family amidase
MCGDAPLAGGPDRPGEDAELGLYGNAVAQNLTGFPAVTVPAGHHASGVPFGLQLTGPPHSEDLLLGVAETWEAAHPWPRSAPGCPPFLT